MLNCEVCCPGSPQNKLKESEKKDKYLDQGTEKKKPKKKTKKKKKNKLWNMKVTVILIAICALGTVTKKLVQGLEDDEIRRLVENFQTTALFRSARILGTVLETWGDLLSLKLHWKTISYRWFEKLPKEWNSNNNNNNNKTMEHEGNGDTNCNWFAWNNPQRTGKEIRRLGNKRTNGDHRNSSIIKIGQNTKCSGNLRRLAVFQTPVENHRLTLGVKISQMSKIIIIIIIIIMWQRQNRYDIFNIQAKTGTPASLYTHI